MNQSNNAELLNFKADIFKALAVFDVADSAKTPYGTKFWQDTEKAVERLLSKTAIEARKDEVKKIKSRHVYTGWAGTHAIYQSSFDADARLKELEAELNQLGENHV